MALRGIERLSLHPAQVGHSLVLELRDGRARDGRARDARLVFLKDKARTVAERLRAKIGAG